MLIEVKEKEFKNKIEIRFNNITEGFNKFENKTLESNGDSGFENNIIRFLEESVKLNGIENSYVDFYYNVLSKEDKERLIDSLDEIDKKFIKEFENKNSKAGIYFNLTLESIPFIARLNIKEILFSTIYFGKYGFTIWGNYNNKFPVFYKEEAVCRQYEKIVDEFKLEIKL